MSAAVRLCRRGSLPEGSFELGVDLGPARPSDASRLPEQSRALKTRTQYSSMGILQESRAIQSASPARSIQTNPLQSTSIKSNQEQSRVPHLLELGLLSHRVVTQVDRLRSGLRGVAAPGLTPEPLLGQGVDGHLMRDTIRRNDSEAIGGHPRQS